VSQQVAETAEIGLAGGAVRRIALAVDMLIGQVVELIGAMLVLAETCILFAGVLSRYLFNSPIIWTDELATFLFLWLSMIGAVVALRRDGHMRLTTFANWVGPQWAAGSPPSHRSF
jgi:TRAP-type C4-dicarboxylate transport system permease small subunit